MSSDSDEHVSEKAAESSSSASPPPPVRPPVSQRSMTTRSGALQVGEAIDLSNKAPSVKPRRIAKPAPAPAPAPAPEEQLPAPQEPMPTPEEPTPRSQGEGESNDKRPDGDHDMTGPSGQDGKHVIYYYAKDQKKKTNGHLICRGAQRSNGIRHRR